MIPWLVLFLGLATVVALVLYGQWRSDQPPVAPGGPDDSGIRAGRALLIWVGFHVVALGVTFVVCVVLATWVLASGGTQAAAERMIRSVAGPPALTLVYIVGAASIVTWVKRSLKLETLGLTLKAIRGTLGTRRESAAAVVVGLALAASVTFLGHHAGPPPKVGIRLFTLLGLRPGWRRYVTVSTAVLLAPPTEEMLFRGVMLDGLMRSVGKKTAGVIVTVLFVAGHLPRVLWWPALVGISGLAVCSLVARLHTRSLVPSVLMHATYNLAITVPLFFLGG